MTAGPGAAMAAPGTPTRVLLVAGELSGDLLAAEVVRALRQQQPELEVMGVGGPRLRAAGMTTWVDCSSIASVGAVEALGQLRQLRATYQLLRQQLRQRRPDLVLLVDFPSFNLRLARQAKQLGIPVFYYVSPKIWAWKAWRLPRILRWVDRMAVIFPFEEELYNRHRPGFATYVGHPLLETVRTHRSPALTRQHHGLDRQAPLLALMPGSRRSEVSRLLHPLLAAARQLQGLGWQVVLLQAPGLPASLLERHGLAASERIHVHQQDHHHLLAASEVAIVASGTATLETALLGCPHLIVYRLSRLSWWLGRRLRLMRCRFFGLPNLVLEREVAPELIQDRLTPRALVTGVLALQAQQHQRRQELEEVRARLGQPGAAARTAQLALTLLEEARCHQP